MIELVSIIVPKHVRDAERFCCALDRHIEGFIVETISIDADAVLVIHAIFIGCTLQFGDQLCVECELRVRTAVAAILDQNVQGFVFMS